MTAYKDLSMDEKLVVIKLATDANYGDPDYTNLDKIDYKFWEDCSHEESVCLMAKDIVKLKQLLSEVYKIGNNAIYQDDVSKSSMLNILDVIEPNNDCNGKEFIV